MEINLIAPTDHQIKVGDVYYYLLNGKVYKTIITEIPKNGDTNYRWSRHTTLPTTHYVSKRSAELELLRRRVLSHFTSGLVFFVALLIIQYIYDDYLITNQDLVWYSLAIVITILVLKFINPVITVLKKYLPIS